MAKFDLYIGPILVRDHNQAMKDKQSLYIYCDGRSRRPNIERLQLYIQKCIPDVNIFQELFADSKFDYVSVYCHDDCNCGFWDIITAHASTIECDYSCAIKHIAEDQWDKVKIPTPFRLNAPDFRPHRTWICEYTDDCPDIESRLKQVKRLMLTSDNNIDKMIATMPEIELDDLTVSGMFPSEDLLAKITAAKIIVKIGVPHGGNLDGMRRFLENAVDVEIYISAFRYDPAIFTDIIRDIECPRLLYYLIRLCGYYQEFDNLNAQTTANREARFHRMKAIMPE